MNQKPSLKSIYNSLSEVMFENVEIGDFHYELNHFTYEEDGWLIEGSFNMTGDWDDGDCVRAYGEMLEVEVYYFDEDDNNIETPQEEIDDLFEYLKCELEEYCNNI